MIDSTPIGGFPWEPIDLSKLDELMKQRIALEEEMKRFANDEKAEALKEVRQLCKLHGFTCNQLKAYLAARRQRKNG